MLLETGYGEGAKLASYSPNNLVPYLFLETMTRLENCPFLSLMEQLLRNIPQEVWHFMKIDLYTPRNECFIL